MEITSSSKMNEDLEWWSDIFFSLCHKHGNNFIQFLLDAGLDVNALNKYGSTLLSYAAKCGDLEIAKFLLQKDADPNVANTDGSKPLHVATRYAEKDIVELFLNRDVPVDICDNNKSTPLHYISENNFDREKYQEVFHILVNRGADINAVNGKGFTPVLVAAEKGCKHIVELLLKLGANVESPNDCPWTVLQYACREGWTGVMQTLMEDRFDIDLNSNASVGYAPVIVAAACGHEDTVKLLIESGVDVKCRAAHKKRSLLHYVSEQGWPDLAKTLVNMGCNLNDKDSSGDTPLKLAIKCGIDRTMEEECCRVAAYLIECGADVERSYRGGGEKLLLRVSQHGCPFMVESLIKRGYDVNVKDAKGNTPLHLSCYFREFECVEHLLKAGADCNVKNNFGITPFSDALPDFLDLEGIMLFLQNGAYFQSAAYNFIRKNSDFNEGVLKNTQFCTLAVMNKFNYVDLRKIYDIPGVSERLPKIDKMRVSSPSKVTQDIEDCVRYEIEMEGFCNILNAQPIFLKRLCVLALVEYYNDECSDSDDNKSNYDGIQSDDGDSEFDYDTEPGEDSEFDYDTEPDDDNEFVYDTEPDDDSEEDDTPMY